MDSKDFYSTFLSFFHLFLLLESDRRILEIKGRTKRSKKRTEEVNLRPMYKYLYNYTTNNKTSNNKGAKPYLIYKISYYMENLEKSNTWIL